MNKISDRIRYNPNGKNDYISPRKNPPRWDLRRKHKINDDPLVKKDTMQKEKDMKKAQREKTGFEQKIVIQGYTVIYDKNKGEAWFDEDLKDFDWESSSAMDICDAVTVKLKQATNFDWSYEAYTGFHKEANSHLKNKIMARLKTAGEIKHTRNLSADEQKRSFMEGFTFKEKGLHGIANSYKSLAQAFYHLVQAANYFNALRSSDISPDGKIGGKGYIQEIKDVRNELSNCVNSLSGLIDTFYDEVNSPYWKKTVIEDHPILNEILQEGDDIIDLAETTEDKVNRKTKELEKIEPPIIKEDLDFYEEEYEDEDLEDEDYLLEDVSEDSENKDSIKLSKKLSIGDSIVIDAPLYRNKKGIIIEPRLIETDGRGIPKLEGHYKPADWSKEFAIKLEDGEVITMYKNRVKPIPLTNTQKFVSEL